LIDKILQKFSGNRESVTVAHLEQLLQVKDAGDVSLLHAAAKALKDREIGPTVYLRGLVELSNICAKDCNYCGIRHSNHHVKRYRLALDEVVNSAKWAREKGFASLVLQAGEMRSESFVDYIEEALLKIHQATGNELSVTLSLGEQSLETYRRWHQAGAHRYLLRIETTNQDIYSQLHPADHDFGERLVCLDRLREVGFQVGTGVLMGLPGQTVTDLARDLVFFREQNIDMIGMGPFIPHDDTPMATGSENYDPLDQLRLGLNMIAVARLYLRDVNIASTTALEALAPRGREQGLLAGANVVMPNLTPVDFREGYQLYRGKPGMAEDNQHSLQALDAMVQSIGETIGYGHAGDSLHYQRRIGLL